MVKAHKAAAVKPHADKRTITIEDAARRLAAAKWPHVEGRRVSYALRFTAPGTRGAIITPEDEEILRAIWDAAGLESPAFPMAESTWQRYTEAFEASARKPGWHLGCCVEDDALTHAMLRVAAEGQFATGLRTAIGRGEIVARDPLTHLPVIASAILSGAQAAGLLLSRADFENVARDAMIDVQDAPAVEPWRERAQFHREREAQGSKAPTKETAEQFHVSDRQVRTDRQRLREEEAATSSVSRKRGRK